MKPLKEITLDDNDINRYFCYKSSGIRKLNTDLSDFYSSARFPFSFVLHGQLSLKVYLLSIDDTSSSVNDLTYSSSFYKNNIGNNDTYVLNINNNDYVVFLQLFFKDHFENNFIIKNVNNKMNLDLDLDDAIYLNNKVSLFNFSNIDLQHKLWYSLSRGYFLLSGSLDIFNTPELVESSIDKLYNYVLVNG